jgi:phosphatidylethanolamine/phosphatidyl-N-methylethanolamine N-methyltransferase
MRDLALFTREMLRHPVQVMALAPSSAALAQAMTDGIGPLTGPVLELGPGTGRFTRLLLARGVRADQLTLVELNPVFAEELRNRFPGVRVECAAAQDVPRLGLSGVGATVSGLPLLSMSHNDQRAILSGVFAAMRPGAPFVQFTYGPQPPVAASVAAGMGLIGRKGPLVLGNLPPARVHRYVAATAAKGSGF